MGCGRKTTQISHGLSLKRNPPEFRRHFWGLIARWRRRAELQRLKGWGLSLVGHGRRARVICVPGGSRAGVMRYPDGGGLTARDRSRREQARLEAAQMFAQDADAGQVARSLRMSTKPVYEWRCAWRVVGEADLASKGPGGSVCDLDDDQLRFAGCRRPASTRILPSGTSNPLAWP